MSSGVSKRVVSVYLAGVIGIAAATVGTLYVLFRSDIGSFYDALLQSPVQAVQDEPTSALLIVLVFVLLGTLMALVVIFGATYGPEREDPPR
jgi:ABC-type dipeptide/oligopeptide/nickel transport system permease subunit